MGQLSHLAAHRVKVLNSDGGAARTLLGPKVTLAAVVYKLLNETLFSFIKFTLIYGDSLLIKPALSNSSLHDLCCCRLCLWLLLLLIILCWWIIIWWIQTQVLLLCRWIRAGWCC